MNSLTNTGHIRSATVLLALVLVAGTASAQQSKKQSTRVKSSKVVQKKVSSDPAEARRYDTVRISKPDGSVVLLRVPKRDTMGKNTRSTGSRRGISQGRAFLKSMDDGDKAAPLLHSPGGVTISLPNFGARPFVLDQNLAGSLLSAEASAGTGGGQGVAGDGATEWRTGRGWAPAGDGDDSGSYNSSIVSYLHQGAGWAGPTPDPNPSGTEGDPHREAKVIARWTGVPYQQLRSKTMYIGVMAFHINGISQVQFSLEDGPWVSVTETTINPATGLEEYVVALDPNMITGNILEIRAKVYPNHSGIPRVLDGELLDDTARAGEHSMFISRRTDSQAGSATIYVAQNGSDEAPGTKAEPLATIDEALSRAKLSGANTIRLGRGSYEGPDRRYGNQKIRNDDWLTIEADPDENLELGDVTITMPTYTQLRVQTSMAHWKGISFDLASVKQFYGGPDDLHWFDTCEWYDSGGWINYSSRSVPVSGMYYMTNSKVYDTLYGPAGANMVRNTTIERISGDVFQNSRFVAGCSVNNVDGSVLNHHTDLYQMFGEMENVIVADVIATDLNDTQAIFLEPTYYSGDGRPRYSLSNAAFVRLEIINEPEYNSEGISWGGAPWSQLISSFKHLIFEDVRLPNQRLMFRSDVNDNNQWWESQDVILRDVTLHWASYDDYTGDNLPEGCEIKNLVRSDGEDGY